MDALILLYLSPEIILMGVALLILGLDLIWRGRKHMRLGILALLGLIAAFAMTLLISFRVAPDAPLLPIRWGNQVALFCRECPGQIADLLFWPPARVADALYVSDNLTNFFRLVAVLTGLIVLIASFDYLHTRAKYLGEFYALFLLCIAAMMMMAGSTNLLMIFLSIEFLSLISYVLTGYLRENKKSNEAAIKYFLYGAISSAIMLYGMSLLYGATQSLNLGEIGAVITSNTSYEVLSLFALALVLAGVGFKIALVPFHMWAPDAYEGAPTPVTTFLSVGPKLAGFAVLIRLTLQVVWVYQVDWSALYALMAVATMTLGNVIALAESNVKRLLAYSSIAQAGYMLIGLAALSLQPNPFDGLSGLLIYVVAYLFMNLGAFLVVIAIENYTGAQDISQYGGMIRRAPVLALLTVFFMLALAGIPPTAGFIAKFLVFGAALRAGLAWLAIIGVINSVISVFYYFRIVRPMFFDPVPKGAGTIQYSRWLRIGLTVTAVMTFLIMFFPMPLFNLAAGGATMFGLALR